MKGRYLKLFGKNGKRKYTTCLIYIILFPLLLIVNIPSANQDAVDASNAIFLKARQFIPEVMTELSVSQEPRHAIIQFDGQPQQETIDALAGQGIEILEYVPRNAVMARIPANTAVGSIVGIRWVGALQPSDKQSSYLQVSLDKGFVLVDVFPDITREQAEEVITAFGGNLVENPYLLPNTYLVQADENVVNGLSTADEVSWIWVASDAIIEGLPVHSCTGPLTAFGPVPNYVTYGDGWDGPGQGSADLMYHFENGTPDITGNLEEVEVESALNEWTLYADITWTETGTSGLSQSIDILWGSYDHGDPYSFDGPGGVLAHCYYPSPPNSEPIAGNMHFDESETWRIGSNYDVFSVALHEAGHGLGLAHSSNPDAVMYAYYQMVTDLHQDDIDGIQSIYAPASVPQYQLTTAESPLYGGGVSPDCSVGCLYDDGTPVTLTATANSGYTFAGWSGACTGTGTCQVTMDSDKSVTATFTGATPAYLDNFNDGNDSGWTRKSGAWAVESNEYSGTSASTSVPAFSLINTETQDMTIDADARDLGSGAWQNFFIVFAYDEANRKAYGAGALVGANRWVIREIDIDTGARSDPASASETINTNTWYSLRVVVSGDTVTLSADGAEKVSYTFAGGMPVGNVGLGGQNNHAHFENFLVYTPASGPQYQLTTSESPLYGGSISPDCSVGCLYDDGTPVTLTATANSGYTFAGWSGACSGTGTCQVTMDSDRTVTATFTGATPAYLDNFNDSNDSGWTRKSGAWAVESNEYSGTSASTSVPAFSVISTETQDMTIDVDARDLGSGAWQNFFIVFAYDEANRKAYGAGALVGANRWVIREIDIDTGATSDPASASETINTNTWYSLTVVVIGDTVTLSADGAEKVSYTFAGGMPVGNVGLGGQNNHAHYDNFSVYMFSSYTDGFNDGNDNGWTRKSGAWAVESNEYSGTSASTSVPAFSVISTETQDMTIDVDARDLGSGAWQNFFIVFAYDEANRKAYGAGALVGANRWVIREIDIDTGATSDPASASETINTNTWYSLRVVVSGDTVTLSADGAEKVSYTFPGGMPVGNVGLGGQNNHAHFDDFSVIY